MKLKTSILLVAALFAAGCGGPDVDVTDPATGSPSAPVTVEVTPGAPAAEQGAVSAFDTVCSPPQSNMGGLKYCCSWNGTELIQGSCGWQPW